MKHCHWSRSSAYDEGENKAGETFMETPRQSGQPFFEEPNTTVLPGFDDAELADRCARRIEEYWAGLGFPTVHCRVESVKGGRNCWAYVIRSNLVRGLPPG